MTTGPGVLCPVDFSEASRGALRYGAAIAEHFRSSLIVMTATDPLLAEAAAMDSGAEQFKTATLDALRTFFSETVDRCLRGTVVTFESVVGKPDEAIRKVASLRGADLVVMSSHGLSGFRKLFFGSTTERVLRETQVPVLVVPGRGDGPVDAADAALRVRRIVVPTLLPPVHPHQMEAARAIAAAVKAQVVVLSVIEPLRGVIPQTDPYLASVERERRLRAQHQLEHFAETARATRVEALIAHGEPSEEIVKVARDRAAGLIVMGLYASPAAGPRLGSVTYRVLCAASCPVLALPAGKFSPRAKKTAPPAPAETRQSANLLNESANSWSGTARALKRADTRFDT